MKDRHYDVTMRFDKNKPWKAVAIGVIFNDGDSGIEYIVDRAELGEFTRELTSSSRLIGHLAAPGKKDWAVDLTGVRDLKTGLDTCNQEMTARCR